MPQLNQAASLRFWRAVNVSSPDHTAHPQTLSYFTMEKGNVQQLLLSPSDDTFYSFLPSPGPVEEATTLKLNTYEEDIIESIQSLENEKKDPRRTMPICQLSKRICKSVARAWQTSRLNCRKGASSRKQMIC